MVSVLEIDFVKFFFFFFVDSLFKLVYTLLFLFNFVYVLGKFLKLLCVKNHAKLTIMSVFS
ncbi:hypothetical protein EJD97_025830 [Solanum chilense]|uniref:Uncharacterized protein n=1 Tax=Solanum chilense TaxID=4083 RepID=A0A6N2BZW2_SOLCI|nr:hypothetical protein EJD97_025830 [Solanum chilense]